MDREENFSAELQTRLKMFSSTPIMLFRLPRKGRPTFKTIDIVHQRRNSISCFGGLRT
jgi:hypothetical protein